MAIPIITLADLECVQACSEQVRLFKRLFSKELKLTLKAAKTYGYKFNTWWAAFARELNKQGGIQI